MLSKPAKAKSNSIGTRPVLLLAAMLALTAGAPAFAVITATFGSSPPSPQNGTPSSGLSGDFKRASRFTLTQQGILQSIGAFVDGNGGASGHQLLRYVLYRDTGSGPGEKIVETPTVEIFSGGSPFWYDASVPGVVVDPGSYWIAIQSDSNGAGVVRDYTLGTAPNWLGNADTFADGASDSFGAGIVGTGTLEVRVQYWPTAGLSSFGRMDAATIPSSGLSADYKRASKFVLSEKATLAGLSAYLDSAGGASGTQKVTLVLYRDQGGVPGAEVVASSDVTISAGQVHGWVFFQSPSAALDPGSYWIAIHSGATGGVVRDYGDGAANWYGNADNYSDGPANPFGSGTSGTATLSVHALYQPGYSIAQISGGAPYNSSASNGLTANYIRGSLAFCPSGVPWGPTGVTGFSAYLDGNGGASGSQALRVAWYDFDNNPGDNNVPIAKVAESGVVTITAGTAPQWVFFPLSTTMELQIPMVLAVQSGDVGGVVRDFGNPGEGPWFGAPAPFANGAPDPWPATLSTGTTQLAIYPVCVVPAPWWTAQSP
jgi:hypothetical protein